MAPPRVTVVIPTYNRADLLAEAIASVLGQTLTDLELFVSDNGSRDHTEAVVASFGDPRVHYAPLERNHGPHANFTRTLRLGTAPIVAPLQDDDTFLPDNLERKVSLLEEHPEVAVVHSAFRYIDAGGAVFREHMTFAGLHWDAVETGKEFLAKSLGGGSRILFSAAVIRRSSAAGIEFSPEDGGPCDLGVWLRLALRGDVAYLAEPLVANRVHERSYTLSSGEFERDEDLHLHTFEVVEAVQRVKLRFLEECGDQLDDPLAALGLTKDYSRRVLRMIVHRSSRPGRRAIDTPRLLMRAARLEPTLLRDPAAFRMLAASLVGERLRTRFRGG